MATHFYNPSSSMMTAANFDSQAAITIGVNTNFNPNRGGACTHNFHSDSGHEGDASGASSHHDADDDDVQSHFSDIAQAAAKAMEHIDMDKLCSELFSQEMLTQEMLEEAVASATGVSAADLAALAAPTGDVGAGVVTPHGADGASADMVAANTTTAAAAGGLVTDCASSTDGSEGSVPSTIDVPSVQPSGFPVELAPRPSEAPKVGVNEPSSNYPQAQDALSPLQFSHEQAAKRQRLHAAPIHHGFPGVQQPLRQRAPPMANFPQAAAPANQSPNPNFAPQANVQAVLPPKAFHQEDEAICVQCQFPGADVRICCPSGCAYHARCLDLMALCREAKDSSVCNHSSKKNVSGDIRVSTCPCCASPSSGMEILPLSFSEMDRVQQSARAAFAGLSAMGGSSSPKRSHDTLLHHRLPTAIPSHAGAQPRRTVQCYDPTQPRTGRWTEEEILFRDTLISHFLSGALPLSNGLKLNDFLPVMLKSKQSRLAKKMKHAKLSTKYFYPKGGCVPAAADAARELSRMETEFMNTIPDPVERSELKFHMGREWREHFATRCHSLRITFSGHAWLSSVEDMERRLSFEKERHRLVKRRFMMGKAMEKDGETIERGVFVENGRDSKEEFELVVEKSISNSAGRNSGYLSSPLLGGKDKETSPSVWTSNEPNFKTAAPFLAGIASYIERNGVPFEHVDVWVPSHAENAGGSGSSSPNPIDANSPDGNFRLCFGGSVTMGVQIVDEASPEAGSSSNGTSIPAAPSGAMRRLPITSEDKTNFSLFGDYSTKFSFSSGCGLPGRIFESGIPAWEQFVSQAPPSLFERRGGAIQFGVKTAVGMPIDSPNVGRVVLVLYSKYDRSKDEQLVGRMITDLKLLNPCPRWKLVVDVDTPAGASGSCLPSSMQAPPPDVNARSSPVMSTLSRGTSAGSAVSSQQANQFYNNSNTQAALADNNVDPVISNKERQIKSLILLLASNIPSDMNSPLGRQLQGIMSLRLILLRGNRRTPEEEQLVDTVLVLYESYIHAGRNESDIAVMVARDFTFHLGHSGGLATHFGCPPPGQGQGMQISPQAGPTHAAAPSVRQGAPQGQTSPSMYANNAPVAQPPVPPPMPAMLNNMGSSPLMGPIMNNNSAMGCYNFHNAPQVHNPRSPAMMGSPPVMNYGVPHATFQQQQQQHPSSQSMSFFSRQNSDGSFVGGSPRSTATR